MNKIINLRIMEIKGILHFSAYADNFSRRGQLIALKGVDDLVRIWLMRMARDVFDLLPLDRINVRSNIAMKEKHSKALDFLFLLLEVTNAWLGRLNTEASAGGNILFYNVSDDLRYKSLYELIKERSTTEVFYRSLDLGFNREKREWTKRQTVQPDEFFPYLVENRIGKIITINSYLLDSFIEDHGCHAAPILKKMGVRLVKIRNDPPDLNFVGYLREGFHDDGNTLLFSNLQCLTKEWQKICNTREPTYVAIPQDYERKPSKILKDDYKVVVLSNSRWESTSKWSQVSRSLLAELGNYADLTTWYMAMRQLNLESDCRPILKQVVNSQIHQFFFVVAQELKYLILENLIPQLDGRKLEVYGDVGWMNVCKDHYQGSLDNQGIDELFKRDDIVMLLMNCSYTYLDASGPVYDMIRRGVHWVNVPPVVKSGALDELSNLEYQDSPGLTSLLMNVRSQYGKAAGALERYRNLLESSVETIIGTVTDTQTDVNCFAGSQYMHEHLMTEKIGKYISENEDFLGICMRDLFGHFRGNL